MSSPRIELTGRQRLLLLLIVVVPSLIRLVGIDNQLLGHDEWRETETATIARHFVEDPNIFYPRVNWGAPGPGYVEAEFQLLPWIASRLYLVFGHRPWLGRALAVVLGGLATLLLFRLARHVLRPRAALLAALSFASAPLLFRYGRAFMPEALVLVFYLLAAERFACWMHDRRWRSIVTAGAVLALAILVKPTSVHIGLLAGILAFRRGGLRTLFGPQMLTFGAIALLPAICWYTHAAQLHLEYGNTFGVISGGDSKWGNVSWWLDPTFYRNLQNIDVVYGMGYTGSLLALLAMGMGRPLVLRYAVIAWLAVVFVYYMIVARYAGHESRGIQYHVYVLVPLSLATAGGAMSAWRYLRHRMPRRWAMAAVAVPILAMTAQQWRSNVRFLRLPQDDLFLRAGQALAQVSAPDDRVVVTSTDCAVDDGATNNFEEPKVMFHAWRRGRILPADRLNAQTLRQTVERASARWLVVLDRALERTPGGPTADFRTAIAQYEVAASGEGFRVLRVAAR
ncbi:MAG: ArnT family glycosyltransferase [Planctomycetota bacterium]